MHLRRRAGPGHAATPVAARAIIRRHLSLRPRHMPVLGGLNNTGAVMPPASRRRDGFEQAVSISSLLKQMPRYCSIMSF